MLVLVCAFIAFATNTTSASDYGYTLNGNQATITGYAGTATSISIGPTVDGHPVVAIGNGAFFGQTALTFVTIKNSVTSIGDEAFYGCTALTSVTIPNSVRTIGVGAFTGCTALTSVTIPNSVTDLGSGAFDGCTALTSVTIGSGVTFIGWNTFTGCTHLTSLTIGNSVKTIGVEAFQGCSALTSVTIPSSVTVISHEAFGDCTSLTSMNFLGLVAPSVGTHGGSYLDWITGTSPNIMGHAYAASNFPAPGHTFHALTMGTNLNPATHFLVTAPSSTVWEAGFSVTVTALDLHNNVAADYGGTVHFTSTDDAAILPANYQFVGGDSGVHTFQSIELFTIGYQTITATSVTHYPIMPITGKSNAILVKGNFMIDVNSAYGNPTPSNYAIQGSSFTASVSSPDGPTFYQHSERHVCIGYSIDGGPLTAGTSYTFTNVQGPHDITFEWKEQFEMLFVANGLGSDSVGTVLTVGTTSYSSSQVGSASGWYDTMPTLHWTQDVPGTTGVRYDLKTAITSYPPAQILINTATYQTQYQLTMSTTYGTTSPSVGTHWYDAGSVVSITAAPPAHALPIHLFRGWYGGTGPGAYTGTSNHATVTMIRPISERAVWS